MPSGPSVQNPINTVGPIAPVDIADIAPIYVYIDNQQIPYEQYASDPSYHGSNSLWIAGKTDWVQYAAVPLGSNVQLVAVSPITGNGYLSMTDPSGKMTNYNYPAYTYSSLNFYANSIGRYTLYTMVYGNPSNQVVIDVAKQ
jgi:hypothetical protein